MRRDCPAALAEDWMSAMMSGLGVSSSGSNPQRLNPSHEFGAKSCGMRSNLLLSRHNIGSMGAAVTDLSDAGIIRLDESNLALADGFDCGDKDLNEFLRDDALDHMKNKVAVTYLFMNEGKMLGYFSLSMFAIEPKKKALQILHQRGKKYKLFPAVLIGRLCVRENIQGAGVGTKIISAIIGKVMQASEEIGCRFIIVDSYPVPRVLKFYKSNNFLDLQAVKKEGENVRMYIDLLGEF